MLDQRDDEGVEDRRLLLARPPAGQLQEGEVREGDFVWRPAGNRHLARSPNGALVLSFFLKPNRFLTGPNAGKALE